MSWSYRPELDGLRSVAVYLVLLFHTHMAWMSGGFIGVDVFFVLSGFLVTNVIMSEVDRTGTINLGGFYARRVRRLLPAAVLVIVVTCAVWLLVASLPQRTELIRDAQAALLYVANWHFVLEADDYFAADAETSPFLHFWSLAIEEQFYVLFPVLLLLLVRRFRDRPGRAVAVVAGLGLASLAAQVVWAQVDATHAYYGTEARLYQLLAGATLALGLRMAWAAGTGATRGNGGAQLLPGGLLAAAGLAGLAVLGSGLVDLTPSDRGIAATAASVAVIAGLATAPRSVAGRVLALPVPVYLGKISYGTYLWHWPVILLLAMFLDVRPLILAVLAGVVATALAALSYELFESPIRRAPALKPFRWSVVGAGLVTSVVTALLVVGPVLSDPRAPATSVASAATGSISEKLATDHLDAKVPRDLDYEELALDRGPADQWCTSEAPEDCRVLDGDAGHVVVVGDSHARMITPAMERLAEEKGFALSVNIVSSCTWHAGMWYVRAGASNEEQCREGREGFWTDTLPRLDPDVVVLASMSRSQPGWEGAFVDDEGNERPLHEHQAQATSRTLDLIEDAGATAVVFKSMLGTEGYDVEGWDPLDCLARAETLRDCVVVPPDQRPVVDSFYDAEAAARDSVATVDVMPLVCPDAPLCAPILDGTVVWRNPNHLTAQVLVEVRDGIWRQMRRGGAVDALG